MSKLSYTQVLLHKKLTDSSFLKDVVFIPTQFAKVGKYIKISYENEEYQDSWLVKEVYNTYTEDYIKEHERDHLRQRNASDI